MVMANSFASLARRRDEFAFGPFVERSEVATLAEYPELVGPFQAMCQQNRITQIPTILITDMPQLDATRAMPQHNQILVDRSFFKNASPAHQLAALAFETGHILDGHFLSRRKHEMAADRLAVQLLGSREPMLNFINDHRRYRGDTDYYGTLQLQAANIRDTDPDNRSMLNWMISEHEKRFARQGKTSESPSPNASR